MEITTLEKQTTKQGIRIITGNEITALEICDLVISLNKIYSLYLIFSTIEPVGTEHNLHSYKIRPQFKEDLQSLTEFSKEKTVRRLKGNITKLEELEKEMSYLNI